MTQSIHGIDVNQEIQIRLVLLIEKIITLQERSSNVIPD